MRKHFNGTRFNGDGRCTTYPGLQDSRSLSIKVSQARKLISELLEQGTIWAANPWYLWVLREYAVVKDIAYTEETAISGGYTFTLSAAATKNLDLVELSECAIHLWSGYAAKVLKTQGLYPADNLDGVSAIAKFAPIVCAKLQSFDTKDWGKVWHYEVTQALGAWLARNPKARDAEFKAQMLAIINVE